MVSLFSLKRIMKGRLVWPYMNIITLPDSFFIICVKYFFTVGKKHYPNQQGYKMGLYTYLESKCIINAPVPKGLWRMLYNTNWVVIHDVKVVRSSVLVLPFWVILTLKIMDHNINSIRIFIFNNTNKLYSLR